MDEGPDQQLGWQVALLRIQHIDEGHLFCLGTGQQRQRLIGRPTNFGEDDRQVDVVGDAPVVIVWQLGWGFEDQAGLGGERCQFHAGETVEHRPILVNHASSEPAVMAPDRSLILERHEGLRFRSKLADDR